MTHPAAGRLDRPVNGEVSFWHAALGGPPPARPPLDRAVDADVCIVGGGYTGLWTAWGLVRAQPGLRVVVVEAQHVGFGASGRNGGWLSGLLPGDRAALSRGPGGRAGVVALQRHLIEAVSEVVEICRRECIDADIHHGGTLAVATTGAQLARLVASVREDRRWGLGGEDVWQLTTSETTDRVRVGGAVGAVYSPHCARVQPAKLVRGLADAVARRGVTIFESSPAVAIDAGRVRTPRGTVRTPRGTVRTPRGTVRAPWVVRATEGFTASFRDGDLHRRLLPMNSSMVATDPLPPSVWSSVGWDGMETLRDGAHAYVYAQRTADGRIALGGRGVPYRYGSRVDARGVTPAVTVEALSGALRRLFPAVGAAGVGIAHAWSGVLGVARDWCPAVVVERSGDGGLAWAGGYVGDGVTTSYLAGLTLADLILGRDTSRTGLPWVGHTSRAWEPEPLRWLGVRGIYGLYRAADRAETRRPDDTRTSAWALLADRISGRP